MCDSGHFGQSGITQPVMQPWERLQEIRKSALKLQKLQVSFGLLVDELHRTNALHHAKVEIRESEEQIFRCQQQLFGLLGETGESFAFSVRCGDKTIVLCDEDGYLCARDLVSLDDHIDQI